MANPKLRRWALDQEDQEEFLADHTLARFKATVQSDLLGHRSRLLGKCRTGTLEEVRFELGQVMALEDILRELEPSDG